VLDSSSLESGVREIRVLKASAILKWGGSAVAVVVTGLVCVDDLVLGLIGGIIFGLVGKFCEWLGHHLLPSGQFWISSSMTCPIELFAANARACALRFDSRGK
jgi:hypothetical protein